MMFNDLVQKRMFLLMLLTQVFFGYLGGVQHVAINRTVSWVWSITNWVFFAKSYFWLIFIIGYGVLALLRFSTHKNLSKLHLLFVIITWVIDDVFPIDINIIVLLNVVSILIFLFNFIWSIKHRN